MGLHGTVELKSFEVYKLELNPKWKTFAQVETLKVWEMMFCLRVTTIQYLSQLHISLVVYKKIQFATPMILMMNQ